MSAYLNELATTRLRQVKDSINELLSDIECCQHNIERSEERLEQLRVEKAELETILK